MPLRRWWNSAGELGGAPDARVVTVTHETWRPLMEDAAATGARLLALWAVHREPASCVVAAALLCDQGPLVVELPVAEVAQGYPRIDAVFPAANRMQRAVADLSGVRCTGGDSRPWLRHAAWESDVYPLAQSNLPPPRRSMDDYAFVRVEGDGVHEVAVGPVHAGVIEPGHFRFSIVGEKVLKLEERLGYVHKGIERLFAQTTLLDGHRLAARVSGDSAVAFSWAYCQALESMSQQRIAERAAWLRALALELERLCNHLGDLGALGNDAGFSFGLTHFGRLKELLLRVMQRYLGQRYLLDYIVPGGTRADLDADGAAALAECAAMLSREIDVLRRIYDEHAGLRDRFAGAGVVSPALAARLGLTGLAGRASGQAFDLRCDRPWPPYGALGVKKCARNEGDVLARVTNRFDEAGESCRLVQEIIRSMPLGANFAPPPVPCGGCRAVGLIEGWRGPVLVALESAADGQILRCHPQDPSWHNWPVLEHAIIGNIVPDFPLINKSFNLSYSGHDL